MDRRDALKSLAALAGATGISVTPVTTREATDVSLMILRCDHRLSVAERQHLKEAWLQVCEGTDLQGVKTAVLDCGVYVDIVRRRD
jgi:hypothetical protein